MSNPRTPARIPALLCLATVALVGCDEQASRYAAAGRDLDRAVEIIDDAHLGFVPDAEGEDAQRVGAYRQRKLDSAIKPLEDVIARGSVDQAVAAALLRSDIAASRAVALSRRAMEAAADVSREARSLVVLLGEVDAAQARLDLFDRDLGELVIRYRSAGEDEQDRIRDLQREADRLRERREELQRSAQEKRDVAQRRVAQAADLEQEAFTADGEAVYELEARADQARRTADQAIAEAEKLQVRAEALSAQLAVIEREQAVARDAFDSFNDRARATDVRQSEMSRQRSEAERKRDEALSSLRDAVNRVTGRFRDEVAAPLGDAADAIRAGTEALETVSERDDLSDQQDAEVKLALLSRRLDLAQVLSRHAAVVGDFGSSIALVSAGRDRLGSAAEPIEQAVEDLRSARTSLAQRTLDASQRGQELATRIEQANAVGDLFTDPRRVERMLSLLADHIESLQFYAERAESAKI